MSSKSKKLKRKINGGVKVKECQTNKKIYAYFNNEEIAEIKTILKIKDLNTIPFVVAATVLHKLDLLKKLLKDGYNINQTCQNNATALVWAVKYKSQEIIDFLLTNGADPTIKTDSGENILVIALDSKLWDEESFIALWKAIKRISFVDINFTNKNGHSLLHMCIRKDWEMLLSVLLSEKPNVNTANTNGVTPLMLACFRNNLKIIDALIEAGADVLKEDNHGRISLCYAISAKQAKPPNQTTDRVIAVLKKKSSIAAYLKRRLELIIQAAQKGDVSCSTSGMLLRSVQFSVQYIPEGLKILLENQIFHKIVEALKISQQNESLEFLLEVTNEILFYNQQCVIFDMQLYQEMIGAFTNSNMRQMCYNILKNKSADQMVKTCLRTIILSHNNEENCLKMLKQNHSILSAYWTSNDFTIEDTIPIRDKILNEKLAELKKAYDSLDNNDKDLIKIVNITADEKKKEVITTTSKRSKRCSKAIKAKLTKIKSAELTKRLSLNNKKGVMQQKSVQKNTADTTPPLPITNEEQFQQQNPIVASFQYILQKDCSRSPSKFDNNINSEHNNWPEWKKIILNSACNDFSRGGQNLNVNEDKLLEAINCLKIAETYDDRIDRVLEVVINYLKQLMQLIIGKYMEYWDSDRASGECNCKDIKEHVPWFLNKHLRNLESREKLLIHELQTNFDQLIRSIKDLAHKNLAECYENITQLESVLLNYEIRGIKTMCFILRAETIPIKYTTTRSHKMTVDEVVKHIQSVLNDEENPRNDLQIEILNSVDEISFVERYKTKTPYELYCKEMALLSQQKPRNKRKEIEAKLNTIENGFHLINSTMAICNEDNDYSHKNYSISDLSHHPLIRTKTRLTRTPEYPDFMPNRLKSQINSLQSSKSFQYLLGGTIRICVKEQRVNYIISAGINFSAVELGLDVSSHPLAVKRIQKECLVGKILKTLVNPLMSLLNQHILKYFACDYEKNELILATPICQWNLVQYVQLLRQSTTVVTPVLTTMQIIKQFMNGLLFLHNHDAPIIHGNLKPANIFIDGDGLVKIAEFGIHKAIYKMIEAPKSSLMWFAKETLDIYRNYSRMECSLMSDIQVAGMLIYFISTYGKHPFGDDVDEILKNIQRGITKLNICNLDLKDLLLWMMLSDPNGRPNINQAISLESNTLVGLLKFVKNICKRKTTNMDDTELSNWILSSFPTLPVTLYRTLQKTNWLKQGAFLSFSTNYLKDDYNN